MESGSGEKVKPRMFGISMNRFGCAKSTFYLLHGEWGNLKIKRLWSCDDDE